MRTMSLVGLSLIASAIVLPVAGIAQSGRTSSAVDHEAIATADMALSEAAKAVAKMPDTSSQAGPLTREEIKDFASDSASYRSYSPEPISSWERDVKKALKTSTIAQAGLSLGPRYGIPASIMRPLIEAYVAVDARQYRMDRDPGAKAQFRGRLLGVLKSSRAPLALQAVADGLNSLDGCSATDFDAMLKDSKDVATDAWLIAGGAECGVNFVKAAAAMREHEMPALIRLAGYGSLKNKDSLPLYAWLTRSEQLARIADADRAAVSAVLYRRYAHVLFDSALTDQAVKLIENLPADVRQDVLAENPVKLKVTIDGLPLSIDEDRPEDSLKLDLASAYAVAGRTSDARALLESNPSLSGARQRFQCEWDDPKGDGAKICQNLEDHMSILMLDQFLNHPADDPYPLAEVMFATGNSDSVAPIVDELSCHLFSGDRFPGICSQPGDYFLQEMGLREGYPGNDVVAGTDLDALSLPGFAQSRASFQPALGELVARYGESKRFDWKRKSVSAPSSVFTELPVPQALRGPAAKAPPPPKGVAALPEGFGLVRFERSGSRAVAISLSTAYDPTGEVSAGGYWVHLSEDGGKHWSATYYTGLSQYFPYVVKSSSRMPLIDGDALHVEVEVQEIDTASITYPPVGLATRRKASGLYLQMPLSELSRDSDHDGFTDIAEKHLLLDRKGDAAPFVVGSDNARNCNQPSPEKRALLAVMARLLHVQAQAIVEPVDRPAGSILAGWTQGTDPGITAPIFLSGKPEDFRCLEPDRVMIVYSDKDVDELERFTPDFHTLELPPIVFNREHNRGYVKWSLGWTGGTLRLRLVNGQWVFDEISSWIT